MREIKFRVWDKINRKMIYNSDINKENVCLVITLEGKLFDNAFGRFDLGEVETFDLMQFTGLYDKNGKEIWEGDTVVHIWRGGSLTIYFSNGVFRGQLQYIPLAEDNGFIFDSGEARDCEVIGNIYENPKLLEEK